MEIHIYHTKIDETGDFITNHHRSGLFGNFAELGKPYRPRLLSVWIKHHIELPNTYQVSLIVGNVKYEFQSNMSRNQIERIIKKCYNIALIKTIG